MPNPPHVAFSTSLAPADLLPPPRWYGDTTLPPSECAEPFSAYVSWLEDHLMSADLPIPEGQIALANEHAGAQPANAAGALGMTVGFGWDMEDKVTMAVADGLSYEAFIHQEREDRDDDPAQPVPDEYFLSREQWRRLTAEEQQRRSSGCPCTEADIPYRPLLAALLKPLPSREARIEVLRQFFIEAQEAARK